MKEKFFVTTTLPYVNDVPHIGFALEAIQADVIARVHRQKGARTFFLTGTDEHGTKIERTASQKETTPKKLADKISKAFKDLKKTLNLSWDSFIRTTDKKKHWPGVIEMWKRLEKAGDLYKKTYRGLYCAGCEAFVNEKDLVEGLCSIHRKEPELVEEENYFFRLSAYSKQLRRKIEEGEMRIVPQWRANEILSLMDRGLEDVSFSRPKEKLSWGIPVPGDDSQVLYVWADALTNYISAMGFGRDEEEFKRWWPADVQVLGKDVLRFHAAIWPAMLLSAGLEVPRQLFVHGFITVEGQKMSKSIGNVVYPKDIVSEFGVDATRYYFLREVSPFEDGDFSRERFVSRYNADLANGLGNFASRVSGMVSAQGKLSNEFTMMDLEVEQKIKSTKEEIEKMMDEFRFNDALAALWELISFGDAYVNEKKPWDKELTKVQKEKALYNLSMILHAVAILLEPFLPGTADRIQKQVSIKDAHISIKKMSGLFPRVE